MEKSKSGSVIVSWSFAGNEPDTSVLLVGEKKPGKDIGSSTHYMAKKL